MKMRIFLARCSYETDYLLGSGSYVDSGAGEECDCGSGDCYGFVHAVTLMAWAQACESRSVHL